MLSSRLDIFAQTNFAKFNSLDDRRKRVWELYYRDGLGPKAISAETGLDIGKVRNILSGLRRSLLPASVRRGTVGSVSSARPAEADISAINLDEYREGYSPPYGGRVFSEEECKEYNLQKQREEEDAARLNGRTTYPTLSFGEDEDEEGPLLAPLHHEIGELDEGYAGEAEADLRDIG